MPRQKFYSNLYVQVLAGIALGVIFGFIDPSRAAAMKPLGDGFIKLVRMLIAPIVFTTDRFMSEARAITNLIGNAVATMVVARWDGALDLERARRILDGETPVEVEHS